MNTANITVIRIFAVIAGCTCWINSYAVCGDEKADCGYTPPAGQIKASSGWEICNKTAHDRISVWIGYFSSGKWNSRGSILISRYECSRVLRHIANRHLYYLARVDDKIITDNSLDGDTHFCAHSDLRKRFRTRRTNKKECESRDGYEWVFFDHVNAGDSDFIRTVVR